MIENINEDLRPDPADGMGDLGTAAGSSHRHGDSLKEGPAATSETSLAPGSFRVLNQDTSTHARAARLWTRHGTIETPCFMPVGTYGAVKGLTPIELEQVGSQIILGNAYHLGHRPGADTVASWGGLHRMMGWNRPILTDSGGYQVFSLRGLQKIDDGGVDYQTHFDGSRCRMTPASVLEVQSKLGSDICMILDHCPPGESTADQLLDAMDRTTRWARQAAELRSSLLQTGQLCFGIVQGGTDLEMRKRHLQELMPLGFDGLALGGLSVGEPIPEMHKTFEEIGPLMPRHLPRYVMGIGTPVDLLVAVCSGIDMFDCVIPTRHARNGQLFSFAGKINIRRSEMRMDTRPIDEDCGCLTCQNWSRAYLRHIHAQNDPLYVRLASIHNLYFFHQWVAVMRNALRKGCFAQVLPKLRRVIAEHYT